MQDSIQFYKNAPYSQILDLLEQSVAGLNTMVDEHFGISVVEYMAAGKSCTSAIVLMHFG